MNDTAPVMHTNLLESIFAFSPSDRPRRTHRVPPGGKATLSLADRSPDPVTPVIRRTRPSTPIGAIDHIVFSEKDSIPHSIYTPSPSKNHPKDTCRAYIQDPQRVPTPVFRTERRQSKSAHRDSMGSVLDHETKTVVSRSGRVPPGGHQTFTIG